jgi:hypothetical protein
MFVPYVLTIDKEPQHPSIQPAISTVIKSGFGTQMSPGYSVFTTSCHFSDLCHGVQAGVRAHAIDGLGGP